MARPPVDVVVPFRGARGELAELSSRLAKLRLDEGDTILIVDNTPEESGEHIGTWAQDLAVPVLRATAQPTPGYARNRGAERGGSEWIVFIDADTEPPADLLTRYFEPAPAPDTVLLAGGVIDEQVPADAPAPARYAYLRGTLDQERTLGRGRWAFVQSANLACRRSAFEAVGGFSEGIRAAEDADLTYRLKAAGGLVERREEAAVVHRSRRALRSFIAQALLHGSGMAWLERQYPGSFPARRRAGLIWWALRSSTKGCIRAVRRRDRDELVRALLEPLWELALEAGRLLPVEPGRRWVPRRGGPQR